MEHADGGVGAPVDVLHCIKLNMYIRDHKFKDSIYSNGLLV